MLFFHMLKVYNMHKKSIFLIIVLLILVSCITENEQINREKLVSDYYVSLNSADFEKTLDCVSDSIVISEGDFILTRSKRDLYTHFQWDSVFKPKYKVLKLTTVDKNMEAVISKTCMRIQFLHNSATVYKVTIDFDGDKICKMETFDYEVFDFKKWQSNRDVLAKWIDENHPELTGFINDQTLNGAKKYLKAIELYKSKN